MMKRISTIGILLLLIVGCSKSTNKRPSVAYVTTGVASFWVIAESGVKKGGEDLTPTSRC